MMAMDTEGSNMHHVSTWTSLRATPSTIPRSTATRPLERVKRCSVSNLVPACQLLFTLSSFLHTGGSQWDCAEKISSIYLLQTDEWLG